MRRILLVLATMVAAVLVASGVALAAKPPPPIFKAKLSPTKMARSRSTASARPTPAHRRLQYLRGIRRRQRAFLQVAVSQT
jgi:hypothetical protein